MLSTKQNQGQHFKTSTSLCVTFINAYLILRNVRCTYCVYTFICRRMPHTNDSISGTTWGRVVTVVV